MIVLVSSLSKVHFTFSPSRCFFFSSFSVVFFFCTHRRCCIFSCLLSKSTLHFCSKLINFLFCRYNVVHGGWSSWSGWTSCTQSCGTGSQERSRTCTSPPPRYGGNFCLGNPREKQLCNKQSCPGRKRVVCRPLLLLC